MIENKTEEIVKILSKLRKDRVQKLIDLQSWNQHDNILSHFDEQDVVYGIMDNTIYPLEIDKASEKIFFIQVPNNDKIEFDYMKHSIRFYQNLHIVNEQGKIFKYSYPINVNGTLKEFIDDFSKSFNSSSFIITKIYYNNKELDENTHFYSFVKKINETSLTLLLENKKEIISINLSVNNHSEFINSEKNDYSCFPLFFSSNKSFNFLGFTFLLDEKPNPIFFDLYIFENSFDNLVYSKEDIIMDLNVQTKFSFEKAIKVKQNLIYLIQMDFKQKEKIPTNLVVSPKDDTLMNLDIVIKFHKRFLELRENICDNIHGHIISPINDLLISTLPYFN
jgi:hypothetical protein